MLKVGVTGGIGSGKSTVCKIFEGLGIPVFSADEESKTILESDPVVISQVKEKLGSEVYENGSPDRKKIASIVFNDPTQLVVLNSILHPSVLKRFSEWMRNQQDVPYVIHEAALIFEANLEKMLDIVIVISAPQELRVKRIRSRDQVSENEVIARIRNQWNDEEKIKRSNFIIVNDDQQLLIPQVTKIHEQLLKQTSV